MRRADSIGTYGRGGTESASSQCSKKNLQEHIAAVLPTWPQYSEKSMPFIPCHGGHEDAISRQSIVVYKP